MELLLERIYTNSSYTIGHLYVLSENGEKQYLMDTIEDTDRGLDDSMSLSTIKSKKVSCKTAIPTGTYQITMHVKSPSFSKKTYYKNYCDGYMPRLLNVKGFDGILIHGNFMERSSINGDVANENASCGCLIVGSNKIKGKVVECRANFEKLMEKYLLPCKKRNETISIKITRKYAANK